MIRLLSIIILLSALIISGCKGKEEKQTVPQTTFTEELKQKESKSPVVPAPETPREGDVTTQTPNTPPRITTLDVYPQYPVIGDTIKIEAVTLDKEDDPVTISYQWSKNETLLPIETSTLKVTEEFKRGDKISVRLIPYDGKTYGNPLTLNIVIANASPVIQPSEDMLNIKGSFYSYRVKASDPDGDKLTYTLKTAPSGMTINTATGQIQWSIPTDFRGEAPVSVSVTDGQGGEVLQSFTLEVK
ncbi:MAG: cadherin-like domain-containing protein [Nitrospirae bacterium]|nr:cadherin-like domain-containing protein [Nitrospirota bacterium]